MVIDTNVVVSGILSANNYPAKIINAWIDGRGFQPILSIALKNEITDVLHRPKIQKRLGTSVDLTSFLSVLFGKAESIKPKRIRSRIFADKNDHFLYELAVFGEAESIVSGDDGLLSHGKIGDLDILAPRQFCERHRL